MSVSVTVFKEAVTYGHVAAAAVGAFAHKVYGDVKAAVAKVDSAAKAVVADVKKDI